MSKITLTIPAEIIRQAKIRALQDGISVSAAVAEFLDSWSAGGKDTALLKAAIQQRGNEKALQARIRELEAAEAKSMELLEKLSAQARSWAAGDGDAPATAVLTALAAYQAPLPAQYLPRCICGPSSSGEEPDCRPDCPQHGPGAVLVSGASRATITGSTFDPVDAVFDDVTVPAKDVPQIAALAPEAFQPLHQAAGRAKWHPEEEDYGSGRIARDSGISMPGPDTSVRQFLPDTAGCMGTAEHGPHEFNGGMHCPGLGELHEDRITADSETGDWEGGA